MSLLACLHQALRNKDYNQAFLFCDRVLNEQEYPLALKQYAQDVRDKLISLTTASRPDKKAVRLLYSNFYEIFEERRIQDTFVKVIAFFCLSFMRLRRTISGGERDSRNGLTRDNQ